MPSSLHCAPVVNLVRYHDDSDEQNTNANSKAPLHDQPQSNEAFCEVSEKLQDYGVSLDSNTPFNFYLSLQLTPEFFMTVHICEASCEGKIGSLTFGFFWGGGFYVEGKL